jgi:hypothetical protein
VEVELVEESLKGETQEHILVGHRYVDRFSPDAFPRVPQLCLLLSTSWRPLKLRFCLFTIRTIDQMSIETHLFQPQFA